MKSSSAESDMPRIKAGEITLNVEERGNGPAFIFIPGLVGLLNAWEFQMAEFSRRYRCIAFDHRGTGDSDKPADSYSTQAIARDVIALMDTLGIGKAHVAGTSTGGCVLQNLAIDYPDRLRCCIFSNTWVKADEYINRVQMTRKRIALSYGPEEYVKVSSLFTNGAMQFRYDLDKVMELEARALKTVAPVEVLAGRLDMTMSHDRTADLHKIRNPSLVIGTRDDATVPFYQSEDLHKAVPGSRLIIVEEGGHYSYRRHWQEWNRFADAFIREPESTM
jgi:aminoacrylate hydrolase